MSEVDINIGQGKRCTQNLLAAGISIRGYKSKELDVSIMKIGSPHKKQKELLPEESARLLKIFPCCKLLRSDDVKEES